MEGIDVTEARSRLRAMIDRYRPTCLWYFRKDYYPETLEEAFRVLAQIERHGDVNAFREVADLRRWLSHHSNEMFVA